MLAVPDAQAARMWYQRALGATILWDLGSVVGLEIQGARFFLGEPKANGWETPTKLGLTTTRIQIFCDDPEQVIGRAVEAGANGSEGAGHPIQEHKMPWGVHRQGGFVDPFGHIWFVGDCSPLEEHKQDTDSVD
jgi:PhnB protein